nr:glycosyltransferase [Saccharofermentans sp.]
MIIRRCLIGKVSIIIPAYNAENTIESTISSALSQTYSNIEVVVVNDGSIDTTENVLISKFGNDSRVRVITQMNQGVSVARNTGIEQSAGE